jgi:hypothetical protein
VAKGGISGLERDERVTSTGGNAAMSGNLLPTVMKALRKWETKDKLFVNKF